MNVYRRQTPLGTLVLTLAVALATIQCGSDTPTAPTTGPAISSLALNPASTPGGTTVQAVVTLAAAAPSGGASVALSSSNPTVATVPATVTVESGLFTASFTVTAGAAGTANITATSSGATRSSALTVVAVPSGLLSIALNPATVVGGNPVTGTVTLTSAAPSGGAVVSLSGDNPVSVPNTVTVPMGAITATFTITTRAVGETVSATIGGSYGGRTASAVLRVTAPITAAIAHFGVSGTNVTDTCTMTPDGGNLGCVFDGTTSTAPGTIVAFEWTYTVANTMAQTTTTPKLSNPPANCALLPPPPLPAGTTSIPLTVTLRIRDSLGNVSAVATDTGARVLPQGSCGYE